MGFDERAASRDRVHLDSTRPSPTHSATYPSIIRRISTQEAPATHVQQNPHCQSRRGRLPRYSHLPAVGGGDGGGLFGGGRLPPSRRDGGPGGGASGGGESGGGVSEYRGDCRGGADGGGAGGASGIRLSVRKRRVRGGLRTRGRRLHWASVGRYSAHGQ